VSPPPPSSTSPNQKKLKDLVNTKIGRAVNRELLTGAHVVADVTCGICGTVLGWKYVDAKEAGQRYKIGKFILETKRVVAVGAWEDIEIANNEDEGFVAGSREWSRGKAEDGIVVFDSEDEDECEDLFAGVWEPEVVSKRRARKVNTRKKSA